MIEFIVWTRKFVGFGDISNDVRTKTKSLKTIYFIVFSIGHHQYFKIMSSILSVYKLIVY